MKKISIFILFFGCFSMIFGQEKSPEQYAMYFKCTSKLVPTFRTLYKGKFKFENNRAIIFSLDDSIPEAELKHCISMALTYHKIKHLPLLGA